MNTPTPREEFEEWLETFYDNSNILSPRSLAWEAWQAAQKRLTEQRDKAWQKIENQAERITYLEGATNHATGTPLSKAIEQRDRLLEEREQWRLSSVCRELVEQRDEARRLAERYRNLSCDSQAEADETLLPWETTNPNEL